MAQVVKITRKADPMEVEHERLEILEAIKNLASLIEYTHNSEKIAEYIEQLGGLKAKLIALGPVRRS